MIATPLGNRNDITLRALETLKAVPVLFAEDSREVSKLLELYGVSREGKRVYSYASHNMKEATRKAVEILGEGSDIGFVSDRGTPGISDPGALLARAARDAGHDVVPVPGPSSVVAALSVSGMGADRFLFLGFPPPQKKERDALWDGARALGLTFSFFESPKRIRETMGEVALRFPEGRAFLAREMTKIHESFVTVALSALDPAALVELGEYVVVIDPGPRVSTSETPPWEEEMRLRLLPDKEWAKALAARYETGASEIYNALQKVKSGRK